MPEIQLLTLLVQLFALIGLLIGLVYTGKQLRETRNIHQKDLHWNRKVITQQYLASQINGNDLKPLNRHFGYLTSCQTIPLSMLKEVFAKHPDLQDYVHQYLNAYEGLARGIYQEIYDRELAIQARQGAMTQAYILFHEYIIDVRKHLNTRAWQQFESLVSEWGLPSHLKPKKNFS